MASSSADDDLVASKTEGFKVGEKKTVEEYAKLGMSGISQYSYSLIRLSASHCPCIKHSITFMSLLSMILICKMQLRRVFAPRIYSVKNQDRLTFICLVS